MCKRFVNLIWIFNKNFNRILQISEALRIHSPASGTRRIAKRDYKVPNTNIVIEKGTGVIIPWKGIHYDPDIYPDPYTYNPDRFSPEEVAKRHNFSFLPFGEGPRVSRMK